MDSRLGDMYAALRMENPSWNVELGVPVGTGWIRGEELRDASQGPFNELLRRISERQGSDRKTAAASFALRYGWSSFVAIAPFLRHGCVPDVAPGNVSLRFNENTFFERAAIHEARASAPADSRGLVRLLRQQLTSQATPVVDALYEWSGFSRRGTWGMITSSWASQIIAIGADKQDQRPMLPVIEELFEGDDVVSAMAPRLDVVTHVGRTHLYQRRASCCRYYLLPQGDLCASCPLVSDAQRSDMNLAWMERQLAREQERRTHT